MSRRIEIELTSARPDGTWTWRAAGAREPKGVLDGGLLHEGAKVGEVLKAEADFELEGIVITSVAAPKTDAKPQAERIEVVGPGRPEGPNVTTQLVGRGDRRGPRQEDDDRRRERGPGRAPDRGRREAPAGGAPDRGSRPARGDGRDSGRRPGPGRDRAAGGEDRAARPGNDGPRRDRAEGARRDGREHDGAGSRPSRPAGTGRTSSQSEHGERRGRRLNPGSAHRRAVMESLPPEQQPIAEQLLRGGIPAVRTALHLEREKAEAEGRPAPNSDALLAIAETLLPRLRTAEWRDRAEAATAALDDISMRDLRSVVAGADQARDDESRALAAKLREAVETRVAKLHSEWTADITGQLDAGRVVRALRLSARPPDALARLDAELADRLAGAAGASMAPETAPDLWASLLEAAAESPVRRAVAPVGLPTEAPPDLKRAAHQYSGSIPALAKMLGVAIPPPPAPVGARKRVGDRPAGRRPPRPDRPTPLPAEPPATATDSTQPESPEPESPEPESPEPGPS